MLSENQQEIKTSSPCLPGHVAIIMDGNGRWARNRGKLRIFGHQAGIKSVRRAVSFAINHHLSALTLYAFSSENWNRSRQEVSALMELFIRALNSELKSLHKYDIRLCVIGDISRFSMQLQEQIYRSEKLTRNNKGLTLNIAANYGGRWDIIQGVRQIAIQIKEDILHPDQIDEDTFCQVVCMNELAPVDLVIRTGGEHRISNFLLWQIAYAELFFTDVLWPDFNNVVFESALNAFSQRKRRFGGTPSNDTSIF
ncbi:Ditrans,polycis-undecaprenyl-diphosphate synthase ((2E,6E)-farnesyl-diphosphate specific) [Candidatus Gullanella endobia]|uniref:Ditrans,polycis-undecaprenyl-diphosphate synthase ((2E,6E)-farnesyl-diphosphate specific) n=1 Tax=Candidatus Gullanella endobia TaxID=1070130 RepID=A0A143WPW0_9ENTR|nr:(2E,6E)-farnesyl-diphosphate-specific ditrans,polycis-undecaprenyl-diphosphate synthase [Candidatus Gullanella endobia]CUX95795.1 Ditrans,polycis-undecaprenyl-diphosphate synthase ((2E,6E)-farnesyl-diphosphate specific) [Candidatus Gullanella endobia]